MILDNGFKPDARVQKEIDTLVKLGYSVDLYCWDQDGDLPERENKPNFNIIRLRIIAEKQQGLKKIKDLFKFYSKAFNRIDKHKKYDYIYIHDFLLLPFGVFLKFKLKLRFIYDAHEIYHLMEWEKYNLFIRFLISTTEKFFSKFTDAFIVVNKKRKDYYLKIYKKEINIIGNWYDPYEGELVEVKKMFNIPSNDIVVGYFGVLNFNERPIDTFINEMMKFPNIHFIIAGFGKDENEILTLEKKYERLHYLGWQKNVRKYMKDVSYILYYMNDERKYFEYTAPNTLYLSISHGIPIITNVPGESEELIRNNNVGYFIENAENIDTKIDLDLSSENYLRKIKSIHEIKDQYKWSECEKTYQKIFARLDKNIN